MTKKPQVFLSYAMADKEAAASISSELTKIGVGSFDTSNIAQGEKIFDEIRRGIVTSDLVLFVVPSFEGAGRWALAELGAAKALHKNILAILLDKARYRNSTFLRSLFDGPILDASNMTTSFLAKEIVSRVPANYVAA